MNFTKTQSIAASVTLGIVSAMALLSWAGRGALGRTAVMEGMSSDLSPAELAPSPTLRKLAYGLQLPSDGTQAPVPEGKLAAIRSIYRCGELANAADYYLAGCVLSRSSKADDVLLAHDLAVTALSLSDKRALPLIAATEDRYLLLAGRRQRFGTQRRIDRKGVTLAPIDGSITDGHRHRLRLPTLKDLKTPRVCPERPTSLNVPMSAAKAPLAMATRRHDRPSCSIC